MPLNIKDLETKAAAGSTVAQCILGICYLDGTDTAVDYALARHWLTLAAEKRAPRAMANLGLIYEHGLSVPRDIERAIALYEAAAERGEFFPKVYLGRIYATGKGVSANAELALKWYSDAAAMASQIVDCPERDEALAYVGAKRTGV